MPPRGVKSPKRARQYEHIKESVEERGGSPGRAKRIAAATVNKQRREAGETKGAPRSRRASKPTRKTAKKTGTRSTGASRTARSRSSARTRSGGARRAGAKRSTSRKTR